MTTPENAGQTEAQVASNDPEAGAEKSSPGSPSGRDVPPAKNSSAPQQRQRTTHGDGDPQTVRLQVGAPATRSPSGSSGSSGFTPTPDYSPNTVRVGGYTRPERVPPGTSQNTRVPTTSRVPRRTNLQLQRLEPWSVLKISLVLSVAGFLVWMVAVGVLYGVLAGMGVWDQINGTYSDLTSANNTQVGSALISGGRVFGTAFVIGLVNIVLMTALATVGSLVYNVAADLVGGVEVTLSEPD